LITKIPAPPEAAMTDGCQLWYNPFVRYKRKKKTER
jgi:hypothetical protein